MIKKYKYFKKNLRYKYEYILSRGTVYQISILIVLVVVFNLMVSILLKHASYLPVELRSKSVINIYWYGLLRILDGGTISADSGSWKFLLIMLLLTMGGMVMLSMLISVLTSGMEQMLQYIKRGRSPVVEKNHIVILGWSTKIFTIINELITGNRLSGNKKKICITILAQKDKTEMEDLINDHCKNTKYARIICRSGSPIILDYIKNLSIEKAFVVLVLSRECFDPDTYSIKTLLALRQLFKKFEKVPDHICSEIKNVENEQIFNQLYENLDKQISLIPVNCDQIISRLLVQTSLQPGLSKIYEELLTFDPDDNEIYFEKAKTLGIKTQVKFIDLLNKFSNSILIGVIKNDSGKLLINPIPNHPDLEIKKDDELIFISRSKKSIVYSFKNTMLTEKHFDNLKRQVNTKVSKTIILGWNHKIYDIIVELENYVNDGSLLTIFANIKDGYEKLISKLPKMKSFKQKIEFIKVEGDVISQKMLEDYPKKLNADHIIVLSYTGLIQSEKEQLTTSDINRMEKSDSKTIMTLINLRQYINKKSDLFHKELSITSEMEFAHNKENIEDSDTNDFIISDAIISSLFAQISFKREISNVYFNILFSSEGSEIYFKEAECYVPLNETVLFADIVQSASVRHEIALGYCKTIRNGSLSEHEIFLNPSKIKNISLSKEDKIITLSEEYKIIV